MKPIFVLVWVVAAVLAVPAQAQQGNVRMYKCIDPTGKVYYSDKPNPDCGQPTELNRQGVVIKKKETNPAGQPVKTEPVATTPKEAKEQERRDRALLASYTSEDEIDAARDRSLAIPAQGIKTTESKLDKANRQLQELKKQADALAAQKKPLPPQLLEDVNQSQKDIGVLEADLAQRRAQSDSIRARYDADRQRFRELKGTSPQ